MSSSSLKGIPKDDEHTVKDTSATTTSAENTSPQTEHHTRVASPKLAHSPRSQARFGFPPKSPKSNSQLHRDNSSEGYALIDSLENRQTSPFRLRKPSKQDHSETHEDAPSVSSGYNSDDVNSAHGDVALGGHGSPCSNRKTSGHEYDPKQYQDSQNDFHPVRNARVTKGNPNINTLNP
jgi:hypothetical protein